MINNLASLCLKNSIPPKKKKTLRSYRKGKPEESENFN